MKREDTDSNQLELTALQWFEHMEATDVDEATLEARRRWLQTPANAEAYAKVERVFALIHTLADSPEIALISEETNQRIEGYTPTCIRNPTKPNNTIKTPSEKSK